MPALSVPVADPATAAVLIRATSEPVPLVADAGVRASAVDAPAAALPASCIQITVLALAHAFAVYS